MALMAVACTAHADSLKDQIEASNKAIGAAMKKKDFVALDKLLRAAVTSDFVYIEGKQKMNYDTMFKGMKMGISGMSKVTVVESKTLSLKSSGDKGTAVTQHKMGGIVMGPDKKTHTMVMGGTSTETLVKQGGKWKIAKMVWGSSTYTMDGKPMDASKMGG